MRKLHFSFEKMHTFFGPSEVDFYWNIGQKLSACFFGFLSKRRLGFYLDCVFGGGMAGTGSYSGMD